MAKTRTTTQTEARKSDRSGRTRELAYLWGLRAVVGQKGYLNCSTLDDFLGMAGCRLVDDLGLDDPRDQGKLAQLNLKQVLVDLRERHTQAERSYRH